MVGSRKLGVGTVTTHPSTYLVEQPISLFLIRSAYRTFLHIRITARPINPLVNSLSNRPQREKYRMQPRGVVSDRSLSHVSLNILVW
jgi:hypothetical protein